MQALTLYFDYISPYAYLAWTQIRTLAERYGRSVEPVPVLFAALLDANGQKGPAEIARKRVYLFKDIVRTARHLGVPVVPPASHPFNPLLALRVSSADMEPTKRHALIDVLYAATWGKGLDVTDAAVVEALITGAGLDGGALVAWASSPEAKERVKAQTAAALEAGAFGVPTVIADGELFWGYDSFAHVERRLQGRDPVDAKVLNAWGSLRASAKRAGA